MAIPGPNSLPHIVQNFGGALFQGGGGGEGETGGEGGKGGNVAFYNNIMINYRNAKNVDIKEQLKPVHDAGVTNEKECLKGTRMGILERLSEWIDNPGGSRVLFLVGRAGTGKSFIANTIGLRFKEQGRLGSFFGFNRSFQAARRPDTLFPTIAWNLSNWNANFKNTVVSVLKERRSSINLGDISSQWEHLILEPAKHLGEVGPILLVIDALDESAPSNSESRQLLLSFLTERAAELPSNFRVIITSRPEPDIIYAISDYLPQESRIDLDSAKEEAIRDIDTYIRYRFRSQDGNLQESQYTSLVQRADGLFQWAFTICEWMLGAQMADLSWEAKFERLENIGDAGTGLDALYSGILAQTFISKNAQARFRSVMAQILSASEPLSMMTLDEIRRISTGLFDDEMSLIVPYMGSLLIGTEDDNTPVWPYHTSFRDFLTTPSRSQEWYVNVNEGHHIMVLGCFRIMNEELHFNICDFPSSFLSNNEVLQDRDQRHIIPQLLKYACLSWIIHLQDALGDSLFKEVEIFTKENLLSWFEVLSVLQMMGIAVSALGSLAKVVTFHKDRNDDNMVHVNTLLEDAIKFVRYFGAIIAHSAPHIYISALPFAPQSSKLAQEYLSRFKNTVSLQIGKLQHWPVQWASLHGHTGWICSTAFSPDGKYIVSGSADSTIQIWDAEIGQRVGKPLEGHTDPVKSVAFSPDGKYIVSGSEDKTIWIWDVKTGQRIGEPLEGHWGPVNSVAFSPDGKHIVSGSADNTVQIWDAETGQRIGSPLKGHTDSVDSVAFSPDGKLIFSASHDNTIWTWNAETWQRVGKPLEEHTYQVKSVAFSQDGKHVASGLYDNTIQIWSAETQQRVGKPLTGIIGPAGAVFSVAFSPDGNHIVSGSGDQTVQIWNAKTGQKIGNPLEGHRGPVSSLAFSPNGKFIVSGSGDKTIRIWDAETVKIEELVEGHTGSVFSVAFSPDGKHIVSGSGDQTIQIWDAETGQRVGGLLEGHSGSIFSVAFSPDGKYIVSGSWDGIIQIWGAKTGQEVGKPLEGHTDVVYSVVFSPDGKNVVSGSRDGTVQIWDTETGQRIGEPLEGHGGPVYSVAFSPDGKHIVSGSKDYKIQIWNMETQQKVGQPPRASANSVAFSPDGKHIVFGSYDKTIQIWDIETGQRVGELLKGHKDAVNSVVFSPDGKHIVSGSADNTVQIWDAETGQRVGNPLEGHTSSVASVAFSPDGKHIVSGSSDNTIRIWDMETDQSIEQPSSGDVQVKHFVLHNDGWVHHAQDELLFWVPPIHCPCFHTWGTIRVIGPYETCLDYTHVAWGTDWANCFTG